jgi:predicted GTPase
MSRWRIAVIGVLFFAPFVFLIAVGSYHLWDHHYSFYAWWPMILSLSAAALLARYWQKKKVLLPTADFEPIPHGSAQDQEAWAIVAARAKAAETIPPAKLSEISFYLQSGQDLALELAQFYKPGARNPYDHLTVPELLAVTELASRDLADLVQQYVPASHILTVNDWRRARQAVDWYHRANNLYWLVSAVFAPVETAMRFVAAKFASGQTWDLLQNNLLLWFYTAYLNRLGTYLIELHSGRLRVGVDRYRELLAQHRSPAAVIAATDGAAAEIIQPAREITIAIVGQVKAGKSSLINALLGEQKAVTDVLPATSEVSRYRLQPPTIDSQLVLLDTVGYGHQGPTEDQMRATEQAAEQADVIFLVAHARNPARQADVQLLEKLRQWFADRPQLRPPPILAVLTHVDLLSPAMEWAPPYNWLQPQRPKEVQMQEAVRATREQLAGRVAGVLPVCCAAGKTFGIEEGILPALSEQLGEAKTVALLRCLKNEADTGKMRKVFQQLLALSKEAARTGLEQATANLIGRHL